MTRPDWSTAPKWATWAAMDSTGAWYWFENEPVASDGLRMFTASGFKVEACIIGGWKGSAHRRPVAHSRVRLTEKGRTTGGTVDAWTLKDWTDAGWTHEDLIRQGYAEEIPS